MEMTSDNDGVKFPIRYLGQYLDNRSALPNSFYLVKKSVWPFDKV